MQDYDIIVMATDGMFDNLYEKEIEKCITSQMSDKKSNKNQKYDLAYLEDPLMVADCIAK